MEPHITVHTNINFGWIKDLKVNKWNHESTEANIDDSFVVLSLRKGKTFSKWFKPEATEENMNTKMEHVWFEKNKTNEQIKEKQTHRYRAQTIGYQWGEGWDKG